MPSWRSKVGSRPVTVGKSSGSSAGEELLEEFFFFPFFGGQISEYPLVNIQKAIEHGHL